MINQNVFMFSYIHTQKTTSAPPIKATERQLRLYQNFHLSINRPDKHKIPMRQSNSAVTPPPTSSSIAFWKRRYEECVCVS